MVKSMLRMGSCVPFCFRNISYITLAQCSRILLLLRNYCSKLKTNFKWQHQKNWLYHKAQWFFTEKSIAIFIANCSSPWVSQGCKINNNKKLTILCSQNVSQKVCGTTVSSVERGPLMGILFSWIHRPSDLISGMCCNSCLQSCDRAYG